MQGLIYDQVIHGIKPIFVSLQMKIICWSGKDVQG